MTIHDEDRGAIAGGMFALQKQDWVPPGSGWMQPIQIRTQLNVDGHRIADAVAFHMARRVEESYGAGQFDGSMHPTAVEHLAL